MMIPTVGLPASRLGGVLPNGDMLERELLVLLGMCRGVVAVRLLRLWLDEAEVGGLVVTLLLSSSSSLM